MQKIALVTGGSGFLGRALVRRLVEAGRAVIVVDPSPPALGPRNHLIQHIHWRAESLLVSLKESHDRLNSKVNEMGFTLASSQASSLPPARLDRIYHLASTASPLWYKRCPERTLTAGSVVTHGLLNLAKIHRARFLFASSSEVYGNPDQSPQAEYYRGRLDPVGPRSMYDESKRYGEAATYHIGIAAAVETRIARIFNTYGPGMNQDDGRMIPAFLSALFAGKPLPVHAPGTQTRSLSYLDDTIAGLVALMETPRSEDVLGEDLRHPVNIGCDHEMSVSEIASTLIGVWREVTGDDLAGGVDLVQGRCRADPDRRRPDLTRARTVLGHGILGQTSLAEGLRRTILLDPRSPWPEKKRLPIAPQK